MLVPNLFFYVLFSLNIFFNFFFFNDTATTEIYTLSLHDALPISKHYGRFASGEGDFACNPTAYRCASDDCRAGSTIIDRKSTRLNSSHVRISYAVFCLKKKKKQADDSRTLQTVPIIFYKHWDTAG